MSNPVYQITVDGIDYSVEVQGLRDGATEGTPEVIWVNDVNGNRVADAEWDDAVEQLIYAYFDDDGRMEDHDGASSDLYRKGWREAAEWLVATFPGT